MLLPTKINREDLLPYSSCVRYSYLLLSFLNTCATRNAGDSYLQSYDCAALQTAAQAGGLPALGAWAAQRGNTESTVGVSSNTPQQETTGARGAYKLSCVRDCIGLPAPTGSGALVPLGSRQCARSTLQAACQTLIALWLGKHGKWLCDGCRWPNLPEIQSWVF